MERADENSAARSEAPPPTESHEGRGIFRTHGCGRCSSGRRACVRTHPSRCEFLYAIDD